MKFALLIIIVFLSAKVQAQNSLPQPTGVLSVGTMVFNFVDSTRYDTIQKSGRHIIVQLWYPCKKTSLNRLADYIEDKRLVKYMVKTRYFDQDSLTLTVFYDLKTNSFMNAPMSNTGTRLPLVFFSEGLGVAKANYTTIYEELASHGIVVATIDHLYAGTTILPNGKIADVSQYSDTSLIPLINDCKKDISFIINQAYDKKTSFSVFMDNIDTQKIGTMGHSLGGNIAMESSLSDHRIKFCINLDGGFFDNMANKHVDSPCLIIREFPVYSDEELNKKGRTREGMEAMGLRIDSAFDRSMTGSSFPAYNIKIKGTGHFSFSDAPFIITDLLTRFGGKIIDPYRNREILSSCIRYFIEDLDEKYSDQLIGKIRSFDEVIYLKIY